MTLKRTKIHILPDQALKIKFSMFLTFFVFLGWLRPGRFLQIPQRHGGRRAEPQDDSQGRRGAIGWVCNSNLLVGGVKLFKSTSDVWECLRCIEHFRDGWFNQQRVSEKIRSLATNNAPGGQCFVAAAQHGSQLGGRTWESNYSR